MGEEERIDVTPDDLGEGLDVISHRSTFIIIERRNGQVLEFEDVLFNHNSAVMLPADPSGPSSSDGTAGTAEQERLAGLAVIRAVYIFVQENPLQRLVIAGHTDTSGPTRYNFDLSKKRADAVYAVLMGDRDLWVRTAVGKHKVEDYQQILTHIEQRYAWGCDPGPITGSQNNQTRDATRRFQEEYNRRYNRSIRVDGVVGEQTWGAFFDVYMTELAELMGELTVDGLDRYRRRVQFIDPEHPITPCGESIPIDSPGMDGIRSQTNRRIEFVFFLEEDAPELTCPASRDTIHDRELECPLYNDWVHRVYVNPTQVQSVGPIVSIEELDKWFIPGAVPGDGEICNIRFLLAGREDVANRVVFDIYGSHYSSAQIQANGNITFTELSSSIPVFSQEQPIERTSIGAIHAIADWSGQCNTTQGILRARAGTDRHINVAFSPYTIHFRYFKAAADANARIEVLDFWPRWQAGTPPTVINDSLKVKWRVASCGKLRAGKLLIIDKEDTIVFRHDLAAGDLSEGAHEYQWNGTYTDGTSLTQDAMPFRVQIQGHSDASEADGVAIAAMQTEVRLFVHADNGTRPLHEASQETNTLRFDLAPHAAVIPAANANEDHWYQYHLNECGFNAGPVNGTHDADTQIALKELQRSVPRNTAAPFQRLNPTGTKDANTKAALQRVTANVRPMFGDPDSNRADMLRADVPARLNDKTKNIIAWIEDRHYYTEAQAGNLMFLNNYRGAFDTGDARVTRDSECIARPWVPLMVDLPILSKSDAFEGLAADDFQINDTTRRAIGPLRIDWTFDDLEEELTTVDTTHASYNVARVRSRKWVEEVTRRFGDTQNNKNYRNCPKQWPVGNVVMGGSRPIKPDRTTDLDLYYKELFGFGNKSLPPWTAADDSSTKSICSLIYDDLQQADNNFFASHVGKAGIYFHPSRVAGDGYRVRVQLRFDPLPGGASQFPNREVLLRRYPALPHAHTAGFRMWRKSSYRGNVCWAPGGNTNWPGHTAGCSEFYRAAHLHFIHEGPNPTTAVPAYPLGPLGDPNALVTSAEYTTIIQANTAAPYSGYTATLDLEHVWPFLTVRHWGVPRSGPETKTAGQRAGDVFYDHVLDPMFNDTWRMFRDKLLHLLLKKIEDRQGRFKGHFLVEFKSTEQLRIREYACSDAGCDTTMAEVANNAAGHLLTGTTCPACGSGTLNLARSLTMNSIPLPAVGVSLGATWLFTTGGADVWAHELGHHRHLEHAQSNMGGTAPNFRYNANTAPGAKNNQHDSQNNPGIVNPPTPGTAIPAKDRCWDRCCIMSYNHAEALYFCGKCLMKNRGWAVERIADPAGNLHD